MTVIWEMITLFTLCVTPASLLLLFLVHKKLKEPLFIYAFYLRLVPTISIFIITIIVSVMSANDYAPIYQYILASYISAASILGMILEVYFLHKMINKPIPLYAKIGVGVICLAMVVDFFTRLQLIHLFNFTIPTLLSKLIVAYWWVHLSKAIKETTIPIMKAFLKSFLIISIGTAFLSFSYVIVINFIPDLAFIFESLDVNALFNFALSICIIFFVVRFFFQPKEEEDIHLSPEAVNYFNLTPREAEVTELILKGYTSKQIGETIYISTQTAKNYTSKLYQKLDVKNRIEFINIIKEKTLF